MLFTAQHLHLHAGGAGGMGTPTAAGTAVNTTVGGVTQINTAAVKQHIQTMIMRVGFVTFEHDC